VQQYGPYRVHPFADVFPLVEGEEFDRLVADIKLNGLNDPITLSADKKTLIDGRNRYRACLEATVDPVFETLPASCTEQQILDLIVSKNIARRHLNPSQRNAIGLEYEQFYAKAAKETQGRRSDLRPFNDFVADLPQSRSTTEQAIARKSREKAAKISGGSGRGVQQAKAVKRDAPDLYKKVLAGDVALDAADKQRKKRIAALREDKPTEKPGPVMLTLKTHDGIDVPYPQPKGKATFNPTKGDGISWAAWSWNPVTGCLHGCEYCYAREGAVSDRLKDRYPAGFTPLFHHERLDAPAHTTIPAAHRDDPEYRRVFVCSMADLYGRWVPDEWITQVHASMLASPEWDYLLLTKFPTRYSGLDMPPGAWVGTSVDEQKRVRIAEDAFRDIDAAVKWLSLEPLREPLEFTDLSMFDWVVIGAQSETHQPGKGTVPAFSPPFDWVARIHDQAHEAGCKVHMKPNLLGKPAPDSPGMLLTNEYPTPRRGRNT